MTDDTPGSITSRTISQTVYSPNEFEVLVEGLRENRDDEWLRSEIERIVKRAKVPRGYLVLYAKENLGTEEAQRVQRLLDACSPCSPQSPEPARGGALGWLRRWFGRN